MMKTGMTKWICTAALAGLVSSCAMIKVHSWKDPEIGDRPMGKTMVLALAESESLCREYESMFVTHLAKQGVEAHALHGLVEKAGQLERAELVTILEDRKCDSILVTRLVSENQQSGVGAGGTGFPTYYATYWGYYSTVYVTSFDSTQGSIYQEFHLETNLYDVKTQKIIWSGRNVVYDDRTAEKNMRGIINAAVNDLRKNDLL